MSTATSRAFSAKPLALVAAAVAVLVAIVAVIGLSSSQDAAATPSADRVDAAELLAPHGLDGLDAREIIERLDTMPLDERPGDLIVSIRPDYLLVFEPGGREATVPMPADEFYMSFAPYISATHPCHFHSLTTCTGELRNSDINVTIVDNATGDVLVDEAMTTYDNGFLGVWLPRDLEVTLTIEKDGLTGSDTFATKAADDGICLTTIQLT